MNPIVSVIMPCFNSARYIDAAIQSVIDQSSSEWELLIVDGGSDDGTLDIVSSFVSKDSRIRLVRNHDDRGPAHARHVGIKMSIGKYIAFLDADDYWLPEKLAIQIPFMESANIGFSYTRFRRISDDGMRVGCPVPVRRSFGFMQAVRHRGIGSMTVVIRRELLTEEVTGRWMRSGGEETLWWILVLRNGYTAQLLDRDLARYRDTAGSLSKHQIHTLRSVWRMYRCELGFPFIKTAGNYVVYVMDVCVRRLRLRLCTWINGGVSEKWMSI